ncbi:MAG: hypothetical protein HZB84_09575 [Deltaproteobacteria bacterium]|nr:hypothetical protein [Deltaproteobacteria bacterium]
MKTQQEVMDMDADLNLSGFRSADMAGSYRGIRNRVLLREPERCKECNRVFISLYELKDCNDHDGLEEI